MNTSLAFIIAAIVAALLFRNRRRIQRMLASATATHPLLPRQGGNGVSWADARANGLTSDAFIVEQREGDERIGLDADTADEITRLMRTNHVDFDEARYLLVRDQMRRNGVDPDTGLPTDPNLVIFK
ncbi:hypothetical protein CcCBS67573_g03711 [Chytriomyces confervae]|uniref:Uncharacterized protein n=1 Tax=Chytriomyces confervae TaxID=246404 RepID=A0A507FI91_9FUNG|nr:hypothetical protein HDU80_007765 [Chytriomyces hyalinus]TPX75036.1 hypothetical protein CcCBS67573_g03711 [Chytriomyces confervae]